MNLTFQEIIGASVDRTVQPHGMNHPVDLWSLSDWFTAAAGELGEAGNIIKKMNRLRDNLQKYSLKDNDFYISELADELADTMFYLILLAERAGIDLEKAYVKKFNEVSKKRSVPHRLGEDG